MSDDTRLAVAREMNLSETSFVVRSDVADFGPRDDIETVKVGGRAV